MSASFPVVPTPEWSNIPALLAERPQWLLWRYEAKEGQVKPLKVPYWTTGARRGGTQGSDIDRSKLCTLGEVKRAFERGGYTGIGFAFLPDDGLIGIDIDGAINPETGVVTDRLQAIITSVASYTEYSPSGKGVHIIVQGTTTTNKSNDIGLEVFCGRQYFTFTGKHWSGTPLTVEVIDPKVLSRLHATVDQAKNKAKVTTASGAPVKQSVQVAGAADLRTRVESALQAISPDIGYNEWIAIGWALREAFGEFGFGLWSSWSAGSSKFQGEGDLQAHWRSFTANRSPDEAVGVIFARAKDAGWKAPRRTAPPAKVTKKKSNEASRGGGESVDADGVITMADITWRDSLVWARGALRECVPNVVAVLRHHSAWQGVIAFDEFSQKVVKRLPAPYGGSPKFTSGEEWTDVDDTRVQIWMSQHEGFAPSSRLVAESVEVVARHNTFHPVLDYLRDLKWDGIARIDMWLSDHLNVEDTDYTRLVARWFLIGMCNRVINPGCKFDYCLVLEGKQGRMKSSALRALAGEWFSDTELDLAHKDAMSAIRGHWLHEFGEMGSIARTESMRQKSFLSRQVDEFRPSYGRREIRCPRQLVFAGTTNEWQWNKDPTGGRRFWPVAIPDEVNVKGLEAERDNLLAEAYSLAIAGERFWPTADEQRDIFDPVQLMRESSEAYVEILGAWAATLVASEREFSLTTAIMTGLKIDAKSITRDIQTRVGQALAKLDYERFEKRTGPVRFLYKKMVPEPVVLSKSSVDKSVDNFQEMPI
ncbi:MAG: PriCT-2 domain-containing protein [Rhodoferax sp.]|nr:PriCT-2 domain-containing protein [Rhodoferax sp.]